LVLSRRTFSAIAGTAALGLSLGGSVGSYASATAPTGPAPAPPDADGKPHTVGFDKYSMLIDGKRVVLWSGEVHPFRLPSPSLWRDVLQKLRAHGYNAISIYVAWNYHSPAPGKYDFSGVRDLDLFLRTAAETGLYVILRPGPYMNAEVDAGGFPGWLTATKGTARTADPTYLSYVDEWLTEVNRIAARHLYTKGDGTIVLYQLENEYADHVTEPAGRDYMAHLYAKVRADGIDVPLFHNDKGRNGYWAPGTFNTTGKKGRWLYGFDGYPSPSAPPPDWGYFGIGGTKGGSTASPETPGFLAEFGGGWFDPWGGVEFGGKGYGESARTRDAAYERRFYLTNLANGIKVHNVYMTFGGTSWGWLPAPVVYTSYDYGAALDEARRPTAKLVPMHQLGHLLQCLPDLAKLDRAADVMVAEAGGASGVNPGIKAYHLVNPDTKAHFYVLRNDTPDKLVASLHLTETTSVLVPIPGLDARLVAARITLGRRKLQYSDAQPMLFLTAGRQDIAVFTGRKGDPSETLLECASEPKVTVLEGEANYEYDDGVLTVDAEIGGLKRVLVEGGGTSAPLLLLLADDETSARLWRYDTPSGTVLAYGPALLRTAVLRGTTAHLTGDTVEEADLEVWAQRGVTEVVWNQEALRTHTTSSGSLRAARRLPGVGAVKLPELTTGWRTRLENPESAAEFDDSAWKPADKSTSYSTTPVPNGEPVLFADDYGFHYGDVWYRGRFEGAAREAPESVSFEYVAGTQGLLMAWLDGKPLGTHRMPVPDAKTVRQGTWSATATFPVDVVDVRGTGPHVLSVLVRRMQHDQDGKANDTHKAGRGLRSVAFNGASPKASWRIQGEAAPDPVRGPLNNGGLHGERSGWHLPGFADGDWKPADLPRADRRQGVAWYRTGFRLAVDPGVDASIGLTLTDDPARAYRVQIFLNGWNMGQYINDVGPQHTFVLPNGVLDTRGHNTLALAVLSDGTTPSGPGKVELTLLGRAAGGVPVTLVESPGARG